MMSRGNGQFTAHHTHYPRGWNFGTNLNHWSTIVGDWNGDGKTDFMRIAPTYAHAMMSRGNGQFTAHHTHYPRGWNFGTNLNHWSTIVGDWNGDGKTDFMRLSPTYAHAMMSRGNGQFTAHHTRYPRGWNFGTNHAHWSTIVGDWNGDGKTDFMRISPTYAHAFMSQGDGTFKAGTAKYPGGWNFGTNLKQWATAVGDWNGDGKTDFIRISPTYAHSFISRGDGTFKAGTAKYPGGWNFGTNLAVWQTAVGDWNGDG